MKPIYRVLTSPLLTEKSVSLTQPKRNQKRVKYTFAVAMDATKPAIKQAVEAMFASEKVKVESVNTLHVRGKQRRAYVQRGRRASVGTAPAWKKAVVTLAVDSPTIPLLEGA